MQFSLMPLPYTRDALKPVISGETIDYHHGKHHAAYVRKLNDLLESGNAYAGLSLIEIVRKAHHEGDRTLFNNAAQTWNHNFLWHSLSPPDSNEPTGMLADMIIARYGTILALLDCIEEEATAHFSNGWVWLVLENGRLDVKTYHDADTPIVHHGVRPLLTLDFWEHAYYIDYRNDRPEYLSATLKRLINWEFAAENLGDAGLVRVNQSVSA